MTETEFRSLFDEHFADLWRFVRRRVSATSDADDVVAETFSVAWRRRVDVPAGTAARLWLFGTARNVLSNHARSGRRQERLALRLVGERAEDTETAAAEIVGRALGTLDDSELDLVRMRYWDRLTVGEIAVLLGASPNAISIRRISQSRCRLLRTRSRSTGDPAGSPTPGRG